MMLVWYGQKNWPNGTADKLEILCREWYWTALHECQLMEQHGHAFEQIGNPGPQRQWFLTRRIQNCMRQGPLGTTPAIRLVNASHFQVRQGSVDSLWP